MPFIEERYAKAAKIRATRRPKQLAVVDQAGCTGCQVCVDFCPVDCIEIVPGPEPNNPTVHRVVEIDLPRCIGCTLCSKYCPWDTIYMLPFEESYHKAREWTILSVIGENMWEREPVKEEKERPRRREREGRRRSEKVES